MTDATKMARYIVIGYGESDHPQAAFVQKRTGLLDAVLGMIYTNPSDACDETREEYRRDLADEDEWSHEGIWRTEFEIGGVVIYDLGGSVSTGEQSPADGESLNCDFCAAPTDDPWHTSDATRKHLHQCDACHIAAYSKTLPRESEGAHVFGCKCSGCAVKYFQSVADDTGAKGGCDVTNSTPLKIRSALPDDCESWLEMVQCYDPDIADQAPETWRRIFEPESDITCHIATWNGEPAGFMQHIFHESTFLKGPVCYLSDLYVAPDFRRRGIARALLGHLLTSAHVQRWARIYWVTEHDNPARGLYDEIGKPDFVRYHVDMLNFEVVKGEAE